MALKGHLLDEEHRIGAKSQGAPLGSQEYRGEGQPVGFNLGSRDVHDSCDNRWTMLIILYGDMIVQ